MRELRLVFGATTAAVATVLAIFMAGLGFGSLLLGRRADRVANPLFFYGALEVAIALCVAVSPWLMSLSSVIYIRLGGQESLGLVGATAIRLALTTAIMAVPTFLMGGTLPAAVRAVTTADDTNRRTLAVLYGSNTLGAVFGAAVSTLFFLESIGTRATLWLGCAIGLLAGAIAISRSRKLLPLAEPGVDSNRDAAATERTVDEVAASSSFRPWLIYVTAAVLGFAFFALELVWYRMLAPILGGTAFTFGLILCCALFGIGAGGIAYNYVFRRLRPSWSALAITCGFEALLAIFPFALGDRLALMAAEQTQSARSFSELVIGWSFIICIVVLPAAFVSGLQFPLLIGLLGHGRKTISEQLGKTYAWNTLGAITGSLVAGFGALPLLSAPGLWQAIAGVLAILSLGMLVGAPRINGRAGVVVAVLVVATFGCMFAEGPTAAWRHGGIGAGRAFLSLADPNGIQKWLNEKRHSTIWQADGVESSVGISAYDGLAFIVNGKSDGNALGDAGTQIGAAALGAALHKDPKTALVIGLGTGESAGWFAELRGIEHVDVVEFEPVVDEMASRCRELNNDVLHHPRVRRIYDDGREYVCTTNNTYDIIFSEPSNPYRAGIATLYTAEFYQTLRNRLNPGGVFLQFLQAYEVDGFAVLTVLATARSAFNHVEVWQTMGSDLQLVCSDTPIKYSGDEIRERISGRKMKEALAKAWNCDDLEGFVAHFVAGATWVNSVATVPAIPRNTDDRTLLEFSFAKTVGKPTPFSVEQLRERLKEFGYHRPTIGDGVDWNVVEIRRQTFNLLSSTQLSLALLPNPDDRELVAALDSYREGDYAEASKKWPAVHRKPTDDVLRLVLARTCAELGQAECLDLAATAEKNYPVDAAAVRAVYYWRAKDTAQAAQSLEMFFSRLKDNPWVIPIVSDKAVPLAVDVASSDSEAAGRLYSLLSQPFASHRFDYARQRARVLVGAKLGPKEVVEALVDVEPHVIWTAEILKARLDAYAATKHPLAQRAERDWQWFERHRPPK
jgi:predicted membrane-bound spermidine synthase